MISRKFHPSENSSPNQEKSSPGKNKMHFSYSWWLRPLTSPSYSFSKMVQPRRIVVSWNSGFNGSYCVGYVYISHRFKRNTVVTSRMQWTVLPRQPWVLSTMWPAPGLHSLTYKVRGLLGLLSQVPPSSNSCDLEEWLRVFIENVSYNCLEQGGGTGFVNELFIGSYCPTIT